jgi:RNA polymerase sigma-70 factor (ECF subfamily)
MPIKKMWKLFNPRYVKYSDEDLMKLILDNDISAFEELYSRYKDPIFSYLSLKLDQSKAEDELQEIFIKLIKNKNSFKFESKFKTWIWSIVRNSVIDVYRSAEHKNKNNFDEIIEESGEEFLISPLSSQEELLLEKTTKAQLEICFNELSIDQKEAMILSTQSELSNAEIAKVMNVSVGAVKSMLFRSKEKLIECFKRGGHL